MHVMGRIAVIPPDSQNNSFQFRRLCFNEATSLSMVLAKKCLAELSAVDSYQFTRQDWNMLPVAPLLLTISVSDRLWLFAPMQECKWSMAPLAVFLYKLDSSNMSVGIPDN